MSLTDFLRRQAESCLRTARTCFDLASAERLRLMAAELTAKAAEMENLDTQLDAQLDGRKDGRRLSLRRTQVTDFQRN